MLIILSWKYSKNANDFWLWSYTCEIPLPVEWLIRWTSTEVMYEAKQTFCLDLFSMFHKTGSCSTLYICLVMQITSYENKAFRVYYAYWHLLTLEVNFQKKGAYYTRNPLFSYEVIFLEDIIIWHSLCLFDTKKKQLIWFQLIILIPLLK